MLDQEPVDLALGGLSSGVGRFPDLADRVLRPPSEDSVNRTRLLRLNDEGACPEEVLDVADARWAMINDKNARQPNNEKTRDVLRGSGANVARCSLGGVLSPPTSASSAFRFPELLEWDFSIGAGVLGVRRTDFVGIVGVDLTCVRRTGEMGEDPGVGAVIES